MTAKNFTLALCLASAVLFGGSVLLANSQGTVLVRQSPDPASPTPPLRPPSASVCAPNGCAGRVAIPTTYGVLELRYEDGRAELAGSLMDTSGCGEWQADALPVSEVKAVEFDVNRAELADICIQGLGGKQDILVSAAALPGTRYLVQVDGEVVFAGEMKTPAGELVLAD